MSLALEALTPGQRRLYAPFARLIGTAPLAAPPPLAALNALAASLVPVPAASSGALIRFVESPGVAAVAYESGIQLSGEVPSRVGNWHDYFNALCWCRFPATKAAFNELHHRCITAGQGAMRGPLRDALTLFDECGVLVMSADDALLDLLRGHRWREAMHDAGLRLQQHCEVLVLGHATLDALRAPFRGLCAKALYRQVDAAWFGQRAEARWIEADAWLAEWFRARADALSSRDFAPLPMLGLPGVVPESASAEYFADAGQFRPRRAPGLSGLRCI